MNHILDNIASPRYIALYLAMIFIYIILQVSTAFAQTAPLDIDGSVMPPQATVNLTNVKLEPKQYTHPPIALTPDKSEIIELNSKAARVILGNEQHLSIFIDSPNRIVLVPRQPGATFFTVLDEKGNVIMQRHAIVGAPQKQYIRIRTSCSSSNSDTCQQTRVYFCPDMCHEIAMPSANQKATQQEDMTAQNNLASNQNLSSQDLP